RLLLLYSEAPLKPAARYRLPRLFWITVRHAAAGPGPAPCAAADCRARPGPDAPPALRVLCFLRRALTAASSGDAKGGRQRCQAVRYSSIWTFACVARITATACFAAYSAL